MLGGMKAELADLESHLLGDPAYRREMFLGFIIGKAFGADQRADASIAGMIGCRSPDNLVADDLLTTLWIAGAGKVSRRIGFIGVSDFVESHRDIYLQLA